MARGILASLALVFSVSYVAFGQPLPPKVPPPLHKPGTVQVPRLDATLQRLTNSLTVVSPAEAAASAPLSAGERVAVTVRFKRGRARMSVLHSFQGIPRNLLGDVIESYVPVTALERLARDESVEFVEAILPPQPQATSQGVSVHNASSWHGGGRLGQGVRVGIIDVGFRGLAAIRTSELPNAITGRCYTSVGAFTSDLAHCETGSTHGAAVAEAVVDVAPGVELYIANPLSPLDLRWTVEWMQSQGVRIINHSVSWTWSGPGDGTTYYSDAPLRSVDVAAAAGLLWTNSAGNDALSTWTGPFVDVNVDGLMEFSGAAWWNGVQLAPGQGFVAQARWDDSWLGARKDLDLFLLDQYGNLVAASQLYQTGESGHTPREILSFVPAEGGVHYLVVEHYSGARPAWVQVQAFTGEGLQFSVPEFSICNPAESASPAMIAVGASSWSSTQSLESFSSRGPTRDGRVKPDLVGADGGDSATYGSAGFYGTSQSSAHVAGLAALLLESFPDIDPRTARQYLGEVASPRGTPPNNTWGAGFARLPIFPSGLDVSALLASRAFPAPRGQPITWTAFGIGGQAPFEYQFWLYQLGGGWTIAQDYGPANTFTWTPVADGTYALQVWVRRVGSAAPYEGWKGTGYFVVEGVLPVVVASLTANWSFPVWIETPITWTAVAAGGVAPLQYQFWRYRDGSGWTMARDYATGNTYTWTPGVSDAGRYALQVWVRSADSIRAYDGWLGTAYFDVLGPPPVRVTSLSASVAFPSPAGIPITWTAMATGGNGNLQYQFWRYKSGSGWTMVQDYSANNVYTWTPGAPDAGNYALQVWVRQVGSSASYDAWAGREFSIAAPTPVRVTGLSANVGFPALAGLPITWSASAVGGIPPLQYRFWIYAEGAWSVLQDYSPLSTATFTPASAGTYALQVWVRSSHSTTPYDDWRGTGYFEVEAPANPVIVDVAADGSFPATVTRPITWTVRAGGGTPPLECQFWRFKLGSGWSVVQDYSTSNTYTWTPGLNDSGTYSLQVWVRSAGSTARYETWWGTGEFQILPTSVLQMVSDTGDYIGQGVTRVLTGFDAAFTPRGNYHNGVSLSVIAPGYTTWWYLDFAAPGDVPLALGYYSYATRFPFQSIVDAGLSMSGDGRGCNQLWGRFAVLDLLYAFDGSLERFAADFEQHCEGNAPAVFGSIRYNTATPVTPVLGVVSSLVGTTTPIGAPATWSVSPSAGREFRFYRYSQTSRTWVLAQDYGSSPSYTWIPQPGDAGAWSVIVWERAVGSTALYENWRRSAAFTVVP